MIDMEEIKLEQLIHSAEYVGSLSVKAKMEIYDRIQENQSGFMETVFSLRSLDVPDEKIEHILHLLLVFYLVFTDHEKITLPSVSEQQVLSTDEKTGSLFHILSKRSTDERRQFLAALILISPARYVFAYALKYLMGNGLVEEGDQANVYCITAIDKIFDCFCKLRKDYFAKPKE